MTSKEKGDTYYVNEEYDKAIAEYNTEAIRLDPKSTWDSAVTYQNRGDVYFFVKGDYDQAIADYTEALRLPLFDRPVAELDPDDILRCKFETGNIYSNRAYVHSSEEYFEQEVSDLETALALETSPGCKKIIKKRMKKAKKSLREKEKQSRTKT